MRKYASDELLDYFERNPHARAEYRAAGIRNRVSDEERYWRDQYERTAYHVEHALAA